MKNIVVYILYKNFNFGQWGQFFHFGSLEKYRCRCGAHELKVCCLLKKQKKCKERPNTLANRNSWYSSLTCKERWNFSTGVCRLYKNASYFSIFRSDKYQLLRLAYIFCCSLQYFLYSCKLFSFSVINDEKCIKFFMLYVW